MGSPPQGGCGEQSGRGLSRVGQSRDLRQGLPPFSRRPQPPPASVARTCFVGPRLFVVDWGRAADLQNRSALPPPYFCSSSIQKKLSVVSGQLSVVSGRELSG